MNVRSKDSLLVVKIYNSFPFSRPRRLNLCIIVVERTKKERRQFHWLKKVTRFSEDVPCWQRYLFSGMQAKTQEKIILNRESQIWFAIFFRQSVYRRSLLWIILQIRKGIKGLTVLFQKKKWSFIKENKIRKLCFSKSTVNFLIQLIFCGEIFWAEIMRRGMSQKNTFKYSDTIKMS